MTDIYFSVSKVKEHLPDADYLWTGPCSKIEKEKINVSANSDGKKVPVEDI